MAGEKVQLYIYDLSNGLARQLSVPLLGKQVNGIWHTSIVVGGKEYYFGQGINQAVPGTTPFRQPLEIVELGETEVPAEVRDEFLGELHSRYNASSYNLLSNNCNNFSDEFASFLVGRGIPAHITGLPKEVMATPLGQMLIPLLSGLEHQLASVHQEQAWQPAAEPAAAAPSAQEAGQAASGAAEPPHVAPAAAAGEAAARRAERTAAAAAKGQNMELEPNQGPAVQEAAAQIAQATETAVAGAPANGDRALDADKAAFGQAVRQEHERLLKSGVPSNEAAAEALRMVAAEAAAGVQQHK